jgi:4-methyl-5(b-hydroxyethyl)-thiazole monophosphate biosynthesis
VFQEGISMKKIAVILYPCFSLQEITALTSCLAIWFGQKIDFLGSEIRPYESEDGFLVTPTVKFSDVNATEYDCIILPGIMNPLPALFDEKVISFLNRLHGAKTLIAAISSAPILLAKAGLLDDVKYTAGIFMQMADVFPFINRENFIHQPVVEDENIITAIGFAFREFAQRVLERLGFETGDSFMVPAKENYTDEELTYYWKEADHEEFLSELKKYTIG